MITVSKSFTHLKDYLGSIKSQDREAVKVAMDEIGWVLLHDEPGQYDPSIDGYLVYQDPDSKDIWRINFYDDSYSSGYMSSCKKVTPKTKTITVYD